MNIPMKIVVAGLLSGVISLASFAHVIDKYDFSMRLYVPRVYDNMQSLGYRKYQPQTLKGTLFVVYTDDGETLVKVKGLENRTHKIGGKRVTYECYENINDNNGVLAVGVGSNKTLKFNQGGVKFSFTADPSYNIGGLEEDNTLMLWLSGHGILRKGTLKSIRGSVTG